jgi:hypothetical protein
MKKNRNYVILITGAVISLFFANCGVPLAPQAFEALSQSPSAGNTDPNHPDEKTESSQQRSAIVANKNYVAALLKEVTDSNGTAAYYAKRDKILNEWVLEMSSVWGGSCDIMSNHSARDCEGSASNATLASYKDSNLIRESVRVRVCEELFGDDEILAALLYQLTISAPAPAPTFTSVVALVQLFYRGELPSEEFYQTLLEVDAELAATNTTSLNRWRMLTQLVCESTEWQSF